MVEENGEGDRYFFMTSLMRFFMLVLEMNLFMLMMNFFLFTNICGLRV